VLFVPYGHGPRLRRAIEFLVAHPGNTISFPELAAQAVPARAPWPGSS
jgi:hypothetical protein